MYHYHIYGLAEVQVSSLSFRLAIKQLANDGTIYSHAHGCVVDSKIMLIVLLEHFSQTRYAIVHEYVHSSLSITLPIRSHHLLSSPAKSRTLRSIFVV